MAFHEPSTETCRRLSAAGLDPHGVAALVRAAIDEDLAGGIDVTSSATVPADQGAVATFGARGAGTLAGLAVVAAVVDVVCGPDARFQDHRADGERVVAGDVVASVSGSTRSILLAERAALNLLCHLSGVATHTRRWADALEGTGARVRDTRKTLPGLRALQKYAVRCGGGVNHRMSLSDAALVKDNHIAAAGGVAEAFAAVRALATDIPVEIEVDSLDELREALAAGADVVMLDNFSLDDMRRAVDLRALMGAAVVLEASGGLTLDLARAVGETGVDYIAVGELTHSVRVLDVGLDVTSIDRA